MKLESHVRTCSRIVYEHIEKRIKISKLFMIKYEVRALTVILFNIPVISVQEKIIFSEITLKK